MSQKLTLAVYLQGRGEVKSLTRIEAEAFGVPYPLVSGWPARHGNVEITASMLEDLAQRIAGARRSTASKALRGLDGASYAGSTRCQLECAALSARHHDFSTESRIEVTPLFPGFARRPARRSRSRTVSIAKAGL